MTGVEHLVYAGAVKVEGGTVGAVHGDITVELGDCWDGGGGLQGWRVGEALLGM